MAYTKWEEQDDGRWKKILHLPPEETHIELMRMIHVQDQENGKLCECCRRNPREDHGDGFVDI